MTYLIDYELDEFQPWPNMAVYVYGNAQISYKWEPADPSTGYRGGPYDIELQSLSIRGHLAGNPSYNICHPDPLFAAVEKAIQTNDYVIDACVADHAEE